MKTTLITLVIAMLCVPFLSAQGNSSISGAFADIGYGARASALGGAFTALANDAHSVLWNPAGLSRLDGKQIAFSTANQMSLVRYNTVTYGQRLDSLSGLGGALLFNGDEALKEMTVVAGYSRVYYNVSFGVNLKYRYASFGNNSINASDYNIFDPDEVAEGISNQVKGKANGFGFDIGMIYSLTEKINIGVSVRDVYSPVNWDSKVDNVQKKTKGKYTEVVPMETVIGSSYQVFDDILVTADYVPSFKDEVVNKIRGGVEARLFKFLFLRVGLQNYVNNEVDEKFDIGAGFNTKLFGNYRLGFDYSYVSEGIANTSRISVSLEF